MDIPEIREVGGAYDLRRMRGVRWMGRVGEWEKGEGRREKGEGRREKGEGKTGTRLHLSCFTGLFIFFLTFGFHNMHFPLIQQYGVVCNCKSQCRET